MHTSSTTLWSFWKFSKKTILKDFRISPEGCPVLEAHISSDVVFMNGLRKAFFSEAIAWRCSVKKVFLQISQNSQENKTKEKKYL